MKRKKPEITKKIKEIKKERNRLPEYNLFGGNNWKTLDKRLEILNFCLNDNNFNPEEELKKMVDYYKGNFPEEEIEKSKMDTLDWVLGNTDDL